MISKQKFLPIAEIGIRSYTGAALVIVPIVLATSNSTLFILCIEVECSVAPVYPLHF